MRDKIWDLVYGLIDERLQEQLCLYEGIKKWEDMVADIKSDIEGLAIAIERDMEEKWESD